MRRVSYLLAALISAIPRSALAAECYRIGNRAPDAPFSQICVPGSGGITGILQIVFNTLLGFAGALAVLFLVLGGIRYIVSAGNEDQIRSARSTIVNAVIGIVVILLIFVILNTVFGVVNPD